MAIVMGVGACVPMMAARVGSLLVSVNSSSMSVDGVSDEVPVDVYDANPSVGGPRHPWKKD